MGKHLIYGEERFRIKSFRLWEFRVHYYC